MLRFYQGGAADGWVEESGGEPALEQAIWIDLLQPTPAERAAVETFLGLALPSRDEMRDIEESARFYLEGGARFMTTNVMTKLETDEPEVQEITFVLSAKHLVTLRYQDLRPFQRLIRRYQRLAPKRNSGDVLLDLYGQIVERQAEVLERIGRELDELSRLIFSEPSKRAKKRQNLEGALSSLGRKGNLISRERESLESLQRSASFARQNVSGEGDGLRLEKRLKPAERDLLSVIDHTNFLSSKVSFMLNATLGLISMEQNAIVKIFTIASVAFLPPTLIASIYGMNFSQMPELSQPWAYPVALGLMVITLLLPLWYFKRRGWI
ncbi:MAG: magnesium transporter CorA family protein [Verrucomicrobiota bacterium]